MTPEDRFWAKVDRGHDCWLWLGAKHGSGYGSFWNGAKHVLAHRWSWEQANGQIPEGLTLDHIVCDTPLCVRPDHATPTTNAENVRRAGLLRGVRSRASKTHCPNGHPYAEHEVPMTSTSPQRRCRICRNANQRRYNARKKARHTTRPI